MASKRSNPWGWLAGNPSESVESSAEDEAVAVGGKSDVSYEDKVVQIQKMIDVMKATGAVELEMKDAETVLRIRLKEESMPLAFAPTAVPAPAPTAEAGAGNQEASAPPVDVPGASEVDGEIFKSPMVGTFFRASGPEADPYVKVGDRVDEDSTVCVIEAMKVMNEIKAEMEGVIVEILVENNEPVDYGQPMFVIKA